jgi:hypothetical protein
MKNSVGVLSRIIFEGDCSDSYKPFEIRQLEHLLLNKTSGLIDTDVAGHVRTSSKLCLNTAPGRHRGIIWEQGFAKLAVFIASAGDP